MMMGQYIKVALDMELLIAKTPFSLKTKPLFIKVQLKIIKPTVMDN